MTITKVSLGCACVRGARRVSFYGPLGPHDRRSPWHAGPRGESTRGGSVARSGDQLLSPHGVCHRASSLALPFSLSLSLSSFFLYILSGRSCSPLHNSRVQCSACVREAKFAQRGYGYITRAAEWRPTPRALWPIHNYAATSRRGVRYRRGRLAARTPTYQRTLCTYVRISRQNTGVYVYPVCTLHVYVRVYV